MQILVTGVSGYVGAALVPRLRRDGHAVRGLAREPARASAPVDELVVGDAVTGAGLDDALRDVDVAYYLIHSMEPALDGEFPERERRAAEHFARAARAAGVRRIVYLGGLVPTHRDPSRHLASRLAVEEVLLDAAPEPVGLRASIVIAAHSRSFRFLVRLIERVPVLALPSWRTNRTQPVDGRDVTELLARAATAPRALTGRTWDVVGPEAVTYAALIDRIAAAMLVARPTVGLSVSLTPVAAAVGAAIAGEDVELIEPLMESLRYDLLPRHHDALQRFGVRAHRLDAAVERALRDWEREEQLAAR